MRADFSRVLELCIWKRVKESDFNKKNKSSQRTFNRVSLKREICRFVRNLFTFYSVTKMSNSIN